MKCLSNYYILFAQLTNMLIVLKVSCYRGNLVFPVQTDRQTKSQLQPSFVYLFEIYYEAILNFVISVDSYNSMVLGESKF